VPSDWFAGPHNEHVGQGAEAHQDIADVSLGELEHRPGCRVGVVEDALYPSPVRLGDLLLWNE
jgi:hypothetical protein